jgi:hypothetical protein
VRLLQRPRQDRRRWDLVVLALEGNVVAGERGQQRA